MQEASLNAKAQFGKRAETAAFLPFLDPVGKVNKGSGADIGKPTLPNGRSATLTPRVRCRVSQNANA